MLLYYIFSFSRTLQNALLLCASLIFYAWGEPVYVFLMIASIVFNWGMGWITDRKTGKKRKFWLWLAVSANLASLFVFKYLGFVMGIFGVEETFFSFPLPIGISFFTFQALSYVVDVYFEKTRADTLFHVGLYIAFFPQLIAGPIIQYNSVAEQIRSRKTSFDMLALGLCRFTTGLGKKGAAKQLLCDDRG